MIAEKKQNSNLNMERSVPRTRDIQLSNYVKESEKSVNRFDTIPL